MKHAIHGIIFDYSGTLGYGGELAPGVLALLTYLRASGVRLALLTRSSRARIRETGALPFFDPCVTDVSKSVDEYAAIVREWNMPKSTVLIVGDSWELEIAAANTLHAPWVHIDPRCITTKRDTDGWRVPSIAALELLLRSLVRPSSGTSGATPSPRPE